MTTKYELFGQVVNEQNWLSGYQKHSVHLFLYVCVKANFVDFKICFML